MTTYNLNDRLGTASRQTDTSASTTATRTYDAFGLLLASTRTPKGPFGFAGAHGYQEDSDSGLKLLGHRYFDASTGRFLNRDPAKDGHNWYGYCGNNPITGTDAIGLNKDDTWHHHYGSADDAARAAYKSIFWLSRWAKWELGGYIDENDDGTYTPEKPRFGKDRDHTQYYPDPPTDKHTKYTYHTHPFDPGDSDGKGGKYGDADRHSPGDRTNSSKKQLGSYVFAKNHIVYWDDKMDPDDERKIPL